MMNTQAVATYRAQLEGDPIAIEHVAGLLRRRGHRVVALSVERSPDGDGLEMDLRVEPQGGHAERVCTELSKLPCVVSVTQAR